MKKLIFKFSLLCGSLLITACSSASIATEAGHGEFKNKDTTQRKVVTFKASVSDRFHLITKAEKLTSDYGATDDANYSLIKGNNIKLGFGVHTLSKTPERAEANVLFGKDFYSLSAQNKQRVWGRLGLITGISYINSYRQVNATGRKRSTMGAQIGAYWVGKNINYSWTYNIRNNTREAVDDYVLFGVEKYF